MDSITGTLWGERRGAASSQAASQSQATGGVRACHIAVSALEDGSSPIRPQANLGATN
ncbi:hypothetical protein GQ607_009383 [Colletotrichum asianum]|uniref:Uncharacterized protein n=1 Tax=Colletotrichum asianum TaxID=702518 RepID=A0A8H3ZRG2_9PEZI|nr:hypothetical protein GQ607_009383 [Colletotrichum asianum]